MATHAPAQPEDCPEVAGPEATLPAVVRSGIDVLQAENERLRARVAELERREHAADTHILDQFADSSGGWFWEMGRDLRFTWFSRSVEKVTGVRPEWHYGKTREDLGAQFAVSEEQWREHVATLARREPFNDFLFRRNGPDGVKWMRTSGVPVVDDGGRFQGYRGIAADVTREMQARHTAMRLLGAVENLNDLFVLWDADDRLIMCNRRFREINAAVAHTLEAGVTFEEHVRAALAAGLYPQAEGREDDWLTDRLERHRNPGVPMELGRQDGRWLLIREHRLEDGSTATISADITDRKRGEEVLQEKKELLETALETIPDGVQVLDDDLNLVAWNDRLWDVMDLDRDAVIGAPDPGKAFRYALASRGEYGDGDIDALVASREAIARTRAPVQYERQLVNGKWMECRGSPVPGGGYLAIYRDVDERKRMERELHRLATQDELTGIANRRRIIEALSAEMERFERYGRALSILIIDVDHFKQVNDRHGHGVGDEVLRGIGAVMREVFRDVDLVGRLGGEEFAAVLPESDLEQSLAVAERLRRAVAALAVETDGCAVPVTISIGAAEIQRGWTLQGLMSAADEALYRAKAAGRDQVAPHADRDAVAASAL